jgi:hypothetical protein
VLGSNPLSSAGAAASFDMNGTYSNMDVSGFYNRVPAGLRGNLSNATVQHLSFVLANDGGAMKCVLISFVLVVPGAPGSPYTVK